MAESVTEKARKALLYKDPEKVRGGLALIAEEPGFEALEVLFTAFSNRFWEIREFAANSMAERGSSVVSFLEQKIEEAAPSSLFWVLHVLDRIGPDANGPVIALSGHGDKQIRLRAVQILAKAGSPEVVDALILCLDDGAWVVRRAAAEGLERLSASYPVGQKIAAVLGQGKPNVTYWALRILGHIGGVTNAGPVETYLRHPDTRLRCAALHAMGNMKDDQSVPILVSHLNDPSWIVRRAAAEALRERGSHVEGYLKQAFKEGAHDMKYWAIRLLARLTGSERISQYEGFVKGAHEELKYYGMQALGEIRDPKAARVLIDCFRDPSWSIRQFASEQLCVLGDITAPLLMESIDGADDDTKYWSIRTLAALGSFGTHNLCNLLLSEDPSTRAYVVASLEPPLPVAIRRSLVHLLENDTPATQMAVHDLLVRHGASVSRELVPLLYGKHHNQAYWARRILGEMETPVLDKLVGLLDREDSLRACASALAKTLSELEWVELLGGAFETFEGRIRATPPDAEEDEDDQFALSGVFEKGLGLFAPGSGAFARPTGEDLDEGSEGGGLSLGGALSLDGSPHAASDEDLPPMRSAPRAPKRMSISLGGGGAERRRLENWLNLVYERKASDLHVKVGCPPTLRIHGILGVIDGEAELTAVETEPLLMSILTDDQRQRLIKNWALDFSYELEGIARFRVNYFRERRGLNAAFRIIPVKIPSFEDLGLPEIFKKFCDLKQGIVLITGPTGSGKSSTLAAMIDHINQRRKEHILTVEDPIEFVHSHKQCLVSQREIGEHAVSFADALRSALREDPDIILVGEMRDLETISLAVTAAETGHLVFTTLHTTNASQTVDRMIDVFPPHQQAQIRSQLANSVQAIVAQRLIPTRDGQGRVAVHEVLVRTVAIANLIREGKTEQIFSQIQTSKEDGMQTMDDCLAAMIKQRRIRFEDAVEFAYDKKTFQKLNVQLGPSI